MSRRLGIRFGGETPGHLELLPKKKGMVWVRGRVSN